MVRGLNNKRTAEGRKSWWSKKMFVAKTEPKGVMKRSNHLVQGAMQFILYSCDLFRIDSRIICGC